MIDNDSLRVIHNFVSLLIKSADFSCWTNALATYANSSFLQYFARAYILSFQLNTLCSIGIIRAAKSFIKGPLELKGTSWAETTKPTTAIGITRKNAIYHENVTKQFKTHVPLITMQGKRELHCEITNNNLEAEYILFSIKGLVKHLEQVECKVYIFADIMSYDDYRRVIDAIKIWNNFWNSFSTLLQSINGLIQKPW